MADMPHAGPDHDPWTVALYAADQPDSAIGTGILVDRRRVLTCWHVVDGKRPLSVAFPKSGGPRDARRAVTEVRGNPAEDLAVLQLAEPAPAEAHPAPLRSPEPRALKGNPWWSFGFPRDSPLGSEAHGRIGGPLSYGSVGLERQSRYPVTPGFSGAGVWSADYGAIVALVGTARTGGANPGDAQAVTLHRVERALPDEKLSELTAWTVAAAGETALAAWGWSLREDVEAARHWRPRARGVSIDTESGYRFRGRGRALGTIVGWLTRDRPDPRVLVVTGSPGVGKSAVLGRIVTTADREVAGELPADDHNVRTPLGSIACAVHVKGKTALDVAVEIARAASVRIPRTVGDLVPALLDRLARDRDRHRFNLVVDALDEAVSPAQARIVVKSVLVPMVRQCARYGAQVVVGSRRTDDGGDLLRAFGNAAVIDLDRQEYFTLGDLTDYAEATLALLGDERPGNPYADPAVAGPVAARIARLAEPNFLIAGLIARSHGMYDAEAVDPEALSFTATVDEALAEYLGRLPDIGGVPATTVLTALAYAQAPGFSIDLWQVALEALDVRVPRETLAAFAGSSAANFLVESSNDAGVPRYRLFHQALNDALRRGRSDERALAAALIGHGRGGERGWAGADDYLLRALPAYAARAGMVDALLLDDGFLLHADLPRLTALAGQAATREGVARARMLRLTPRAVVAGPAERAALFGVTAEIESLPTTFAARRGLPYRIRWADVTRRSDYGALEGYPGAIRAVCPITVEHRPQLATVGDFPFVRLWNPANATHRKLALEADRFLAVCAVPGGEHELIAAAGRRGRIGFVDPADGSHVGTLAGPGSTVRALCALSVGGHVCVAAGSDDGVVRLWRLNDPRPRAFQAHGGPVRTLSVLRSGGHDLLVTGGDDHAVRVWNPEKSVLLRNYDNHIDTVRAVCPITVRGRRLVAASNSDEVLGWPLGKPQDLLARDREFNRIGRHVDSVRALTSIEADGRTLLAAGAGDGSVRVWDFDGDNSILLSAHTAAVTAVCPIAIDGRDYLATVSQDRTARLWDLTTAEVERNGRGRVTAACAVRVRRRNLVAVADDRDSIRVVDVETGADTATMTNLTETVSRLCTASAPSGADALVSVSDYGLIQAWDPVHGRQITHHIRMDPPVRALCSYRDADGRTSLAAAANSTTKLFTFRTDTGRSTSRRMGGLRIGDELYDHLRAMRIMHPIAGGAGPVLATAGDDGAVGLWTAGGRQARLLRGHQGGVLAMTTVPAGADPLLITGGEDQTIRLWDRAGGVSTVLAGHVDRVTTLCPVTIGDRLMLASGSQDRTVRIWDLESRALVLTIPVHYPVAVCLEVAGLLFVGLAAGSLALDLNTRRNELTHFGAV
ncbi:trypsin-like peptidase domain-containing protein [Actinoplanes sp. CA-030573]|uniref:trypsin-like peptidase domain-containing protein n=1 Tax=Actinoplanes sp. CA-030573 TaxID=3239898 RepID=UPI003D8B9639